MFIIYIKYDDILNINI